MNEISLKKDGVYRLPDGREFIAGAGYGGTYGLFSQRAWDGFGSPELRVLRDGRIHAEGNVQTRLSVRDLTDTGKRARHFWRDRLL